MIHYTQLYTENHQRSVYIQHLRGMLEIILPKESVIKSEFTLNSINL